MAVNNQRREKAFQAGRKAALASLTEEECKEPCGTIYYDDWFDGYEEGKREIWQKNAF